MTKEILYYTDNKLKEPLFSIVQKQLLKSGLPIISVSLEPINFGKNIHYKGKRGYLTMFKQILAGLEVSIADAIFMCEHDVLYHPSHFDFTPPRQDVYYYNNNCWKYKPLTQQVVGYDCQWLSQLCASRNILIEHYRKIIAKIEAGASSSKMKYEPGTIKMFAKYKTEWWESKYPNIDIRHGGNLTGVSRFHPSEFKNKQGCLNFKEIAVDKIPGWPLGMLLNI